MPPQQQLVPEGGQQTTPPSPKVEPGLPHLQQQQLPQGAAGVGTSAVKQEVPRAAMATREKEGANLSASALKRESQDVEGEGGPATGAVGAVTACQGSGQPRAVQQLASAKQSAEAVDEDDEPEEEEEEEANVSLGSPFADSSAVMKSGSSHCSLADERILMLSYWPGAGWAAPAGRAQNCDLSPSWLPDGEGVCMAMLQGKQGRTCSSELAIGPGECDSSV